MNDVVSRFFQTFLFSALFSLCFVPIGVVAQEEASALMIEEIVVTARKIEENLRDVPATVNALTADAIEERGIVSLQDIADATPGFDFAHAFGRNDFRPVIRGQSNVIGRANAGLFVDGIIIEEGGQSIPLAALERVEVVKGPQSALYGRSTLAGAVNYVLKEAGDSFEADASFELGERDYSRIEAHASGPLTDTAGFAVTVSRYQRGGEYDNVSPGGAEDDVGGEETTSFAGVLTLDPTDQLSVRLHALYEETDDDHYAIGVLPASFNNCFRVPQDVMQPAPPAGTPESMANFGPAGPTGPGYGGSGYYCGEVDTETVLEHSGGDDRTSVNTDFFANLGTGFPLGGSTRDSLRLGLRFDYDLNESMVLTSITGYNDVETESTTDQTFGGGGVAAAAFGFYTSENDAFEDFSQEFRLSGERGSNLRYMGGVYYYDSEESGDIVGSGRGDTARRTDPANNPPRDDGSSTITSISVFGSVEIDLTEQITLSAEARYNDDEFEITPAGASDSVEGSFDAFLPKVTLSYKPSEDMLIYGTVGVGNKPGTLNSQTGIEDVDRPVDEEAAVSYEAGFKRLWMDGRIESNVAVYHIDWEDMQQTSTRAYETADGTPQTVSILENVGQASITGLELDLSIVLTDYWDARLAYAWTDSEIEEFIQSADAGANLTRNNAFKEAAAIAGYSASGDIVVSGTHLPHTSEHQASLSTSFHGDINADWDWFVRADWNYNSERFAQVYSLASTGSREILNLRAGVRSDRISFDVWVDNALDDDTSPALIRYVQLQGFAVRRAIGATLPEQRRAGITARVSL